MTRLLVLSDLYKMAFVLCHELREAMTHETAGFALDGEVESDGAYFRGNNEPQSPREDRIDLRLKEHQTGIRRVVIGLRERSGRTLTFVRKFEHEGVQIARDLATSVSAVFADTET